MELNGEEKRKRKVVTLPTDLRMEILVRLPIKSLMRFRCVQQSWNALLKTPTFVAMHVHMHKSISQERLMIFDWIHTNLLSDDPSQPPQHIERPVTNNNNGMRMSKTFSYGPCNGIFCLDLYYDDMDHMDHDYDGMIRQLLLWNPATREIKVIPSPPHNPSRDNYLYYNDPLFNMVNIVHGLRVSSNCNNIEVVSLLFGYSDEHCGLVSLAEVYDLSINSWTIIRDSAVLASVTDTAPSKICNALVNGVYHWLIGDYGYAGNYRDILCFDFDNKQFFKLKGPVAIPCSPNLWETHTDNIFEIKDSLAYVVHYHKVRVEIWIWNEDNWTQRYNIGPLDQMDYIYCVWKDGTEVIGGKYWRPLVSASSNNVVRQFQTDVNPSFRIHKYEESIVPLSV